MYPPYPTTQIEPAPAARKRRYFRIWFPALLLADGPALFLAFSLSGKPLEAKVSETVTLNGELLSFAQIEFVSREGCSAKTEVVAGKYEIEGILLKRDVKVLVRTSAKAAENRLKTEMDEEKRRRKKLLEPILDQDQRVARRRVYSESELAALGKLKRQLIEFEKGAVARKTHWKNFVYIPIPSHYGSVTTTPFSFTPRKLVEELDLRLVDR